MNTKMVAKRGRNKKEADSTVEVLYQKMGDRWFAFSLIDDEVFFGSIHQDEIDSFPLEEDRSEKLSEKI